MKNIEDVSTDVYDEACVVAEKMHSYFRKEPAFEQIHALSVPVGVALYLMMLHHWLRIPADRAHMLLAIVHGMLQQGIKDGTFEMSPPPGPAPIMVPIEPGSDLEKTLNEALKGAGVDIEAMRAKLAEKEAEAEKATVAESWECSHCGRDATGLSCAHCGLLRFARARES
jgi:hypothetical protein